MTQISILFVCLGNICRSPLAEGIARHKIAQRALDHHIHVDSAGTAGWHTGNQPDSRSIAIARQNGIDLTSQRARTLRPEDYDRFDIIFGMDADNVADIGDRAPGNSRARIALLMDYAEGQGVAVPDPYYGGADGFANVFTQLDQAMDKLLDRLAGDYPSKG